MYFNTIPYQGFGYTVDPRFVGGMGLSSMAQYCPVHGVHTAGGILPQHLNTFQTLRPWSVNLVQTPYGILPLQNQLGMTDVVGGQRFMTTPGISQFSGINQWDISNGLDTSTRWQAGINTTTNQDLNSGVRFFETERELVVEVAVPGVRSDSISINFQNGLLNIRAIRKALDENDIVHVGGSQEIRLDIPVPFRIEQGIQPKARYSDGLLRIGFAKRVETLQNKVAVTLG